MPVSCGDFSVTNIVFNNFYDYAMTMAGDSIIC